MKILNHDISGRTRKMLKLKRREKHKTIKKKRLRQWIKAMLMVLEYEENQKIGYFMKLATLNKGIGGDSRD